MNGQGFDPREVSEGSAGCVSQYTRAPEAIFGAHRLILGSWSWGEVTPSWLCLSHLWEQAGVGTAHTRYSLAVSELRETIQAFINLMVSKIRPRPSWSAEPGALGRWLHLSMPDGDNTNLPQQV